jgi:hypothetical protein
VGRVLVFSRSEGAGWAWQQTLTLEPPYNVSGAQFGFGVVLEGDDLIVSSPETDNQGAAWAFRRAPGAGGAWALAQKLTSSAPQPAVQFGIEMALRAGTLAIAAFDEVSIYKRADGQWVKQARMVPGTLSVCCWGRDGVAVDDDGATVVVSASQYFAEDGAVFIYTETSGVWAEHQVLTVAKGEYKRIGGSMAMAGGVILTTAITGRAFVPGCIYAFTRSGANWTLASQLLPPAIAGYTFGWNIAFSGGTAVISDTEYLSGLGAVFLYSWDGTALVSRVGTPMFSRFSGTKFGSAVALSTGNADTHCDTVVVGAPNLNGPDGDSGGTEHQGGMTAFPL